MEQRHGHYDEGIGRPNTSAFSRPLEEHFIEPGTDTPGPPATPSAFVPVANTRQNRMPLVVPQPRQTNQDNGLPQHAGHGESRPTYRQSQYQESSGPSRQHGTTRHHNATPIIAPNNDSSLMPPPSNPQGSVVVSRTDSAPIDTLSTHTRSTHSTMNSIDPEFNGTPIPEMQRESRRYHQPPRPTNDDMFQRHVVDLPRNEPHRSISPSRTPPHGRHTTPERQVVVSSSIGLQHPEGRVQYSSSAFNGDGASPARDRLHGPDPTPHHRTLPDGTSSTRPVIPLRPRRLEMSRADVDAQLGHSLGPSVVVHSRLEGGGRGIGSDDGRYGDVDHHHHHHGGHHSATHHHHRSSDVAPHHPHHLSHHHAIPREDPVDVGAANGPGGGSVPMEMDPPLHHSMVHHHASPPSSSQPFTSESYQSATSSHQLVPNRTVHSVASQNPRSSQYSQNPRFRASHSTGPPPPPTPQQHHSSPSTRGDHHPPPHLNVAPPPPPAPPLAAAPPPPPNAVSTASTRVIAFDVPGRPQYDRYIIQEPQSTVVQPQVAISPTHHHTYPPAQSAQLAPPHVSPVQHSHSPTVQMVDTIPHRIQQSQSRVHPGYTYTTNQPAPPTQSQYTVNHGGYTQPHSQQFTGQNGQYHQQVAAAPPPPPAVHPPPYRAAMVTSPHPPQPRRIEHCDSPMEYTNTRQHHPVRPRSRSPSPYHRRSRSNEVPNRMESDHHRDSLGNREVRRDRDERNNRDQSRDRDHDDRCQSLDRQRRRNDSAHCAHNGCCGTPGANDRNGTNNTSTPVQSEPMQQGGIPQSPQNQLVPAANQNQMQSQSNQLALQQNRSTSDLIQMSNLSTQIQMNGINHTLGAMLVPILKDQGVQQGHREMQQSYQVQNDIRDLRTQFSDMEAKYETMLCQQRDDIRNQMKELLDQTRRTNKNEKAPSISCGTSERSGPSRRPDLIRTPDSSSNSQYSDADQCSPHSAGRRPHLYRQRTRHEPYSTTRGEYGSSENSPQSPQVHQRRLQRNISGNSGGYSSAQSSPIDSAMEDHSFQPNSISPTNNQFSDLTSEQVCAKLQEWQVTSDIVQNFRREKITGRHLNYLNEFMIKKGILSPATETENPRTVRPLAERLGPLKTVCRALKMNVGQAKVLPTTESHDVMTMSTPDDVVLWLRSIGLPEYSRSFAEEQVNGANLLELCEIDLIVTLGMDKLGDRLTFMLEREMLN